MASLYDIVTVKNEEFYRLDKNIVSKEDVPQPVLEVLTNQNVVDENAMIIVDEKTSEGQAPTEENIEDIKKAKKSGDKPEAGADESDKENKDDDDSSENSDDKKTEEPDIDSDDDSDEDDEEETTQPEQKAPEKSARAAQPDVDSFRSSVPQSKPGMGFPRVNGKTVDIFDGQTPHTHLKNVGGLMVPLSAQNFRTKSDGQILTKLQELGRTPIDFNAIQQERDAASNAGNAGNGPDNGMLLDNSESDDNV